MNAKRTSQIAAATGLLLAAAIGFHLAGFHEWRQLLLIATTILAGIPIALYLAHLAEEWNSDRIELPMTRKDLASHIGTTPETISRKLAEFEDAGWIQQLSQREIEILDMDALLLV